VRERIHIPVTGISFPKIKRASYQALKIVVNSGHQSKPYRTQELRIEPKIGMK